jgi:2-oxoisovalerate dehydrogenase E1 component alpha subunit
LTSAENEILSTSQDLMVPPPSPAVYPSKYPYDGAVQELQAHKLLALYHTMVMARAMDRRFWSVEDSPVHIPTSWGGPRAQRAGRGRSHWISQAGYEAVQVAAAAALRQGIDWAVPNRGDLALRLALGLSPKDLMLSIFDSRRARIVTTSGLAGNHIVHAAGIAYASKLRGLDEVTLASTDHRGIEAGDWHEGLNFAAVHRLPVVCLVQDNVPRAPSVPGNSTLDVIVAKADGYGVAGESVDGADFGASFEALSRAVDRARSGGGPTLVHAKVIELTALTPRGSRQSQEQMEAISHRDPIERMRRELQDANLLDDATDDEIQRDCIGAVEAAIEDAASASPEPAAALDNVFE